MQARCGSKAPSLDQPSLPFKPVEAPAGSCVLLVESGLLAWYTDSSTANSAAKAVWLHGLHIINTNLGVGKTQATTIAWTPASFSRLWMTNTIIQTVSSGLRAGKDVFLAGVSLPARLRVELLGTPGVPDASYW